MTRTAILHDWEYWPGFCKILAGWKMGLGPPLEPSFYVAGQIAKYAWIWFGFHVLIGTRSINLLLPLRYSSLVRDLE